MRREDYKVKKTFFCREKDNSHRIKLERIYGNCLEGAGLIIPNKAVAVIDKNATPRVGDLVHCNDAIITINGRSDT